VEKGIGWWTLLSASILLFTSNIATPVDSPPSSSSNTSPQIVQPSSTTRPKGNTTAAPSSATPSAPKPTTPPSVPKPESKPKPPEQKPATRDDFRTSMNDAVDRAHKYMVSSVSPDSRCYVRFLSFYDVDDVAYLRHVWKFTDWWNNQMSFDEYFHLMKPVPGSGARLFALDLRDYRWNTAAWASVAQREPRFRQPWIHFKVAEQLRREAGYYEAKPASDGTTPVLVVVSGIWFLRDTLETQRSPSYYDLLFAEQRFTPGKKYEVKLTYSHEEDWPGGVDPKDGKYWKKGVYTVWKSVYRESLDWKDFTFKDFPKTQDELEERLGVDRIKAFARSTSTDIDGGAIVAGGRDDPQNGSIVALQNRLVVVLQGPLGPYMVTNDVAKTSGLKDYSNSLIFAGKPFERGSGARAVRDAGELLFYLPNGGQGGILVNGQGDRVELAAQTIAQETTDKSMNIGVRTYGSCATCHAGGGGYVPPKDLYASWKAMGIKHKFYDLLSARKRYEKLAADTTAPRPEEPPATKAWTGADVALAVGNLRTTYDNPVNLDAASRECGLPKSATAWLLLRVGPEGPEKGVTNRYNTQAQILVQGGKVPRSAWDEDVFRQVGLMAEAYSTDPDFRKLFDTVVVPPVLNP
jgi:mono/diheme cytochrome c family protein